MRKGKIRINSSRTVDELLTFIINENTGKVQADAGYNDDLVMSLALAAHTMDELYRGSPEPLTSDPQDDKSHALPVISTRYSKDEDIKKLLQMDENLKENIGATEFPSSNSYGDDAVGYRGRFSAFFQKFFGGVDAVVLLVYRPLLVIPSPPPLKFPKIMQGALEKQTEVTRSRA